jgi:non-ribosomal peptide synthetase component E (peptide arylation enzyme)
MAPEIGTAFDSDFFRSQGWWRDETLSDWLDRNVVTYADRAERAACFVILHPGKTLGFDELKQLLAARQIAKFMWPEQLEIVTDMPMTPTRKVIKGELVRRLLEHASGRSAA